MIADELAGLLVFRIWRTVGWSDMSRKFQLKFRKRKGKKVYGLEYEWPEICRLDFEQKMSTSDIWRNRHIRVRERERRWERDF